MTYYESLTCIRYMASAICVPIIGIYTAVDARLRRPYYSPYIANKMYAMQYQTFSRVSLGFRIPLLCKYHYV